ncbi:hypothetical protein B0H19DRAFT_1268077 [Mycena capillaripes]|nr:hypothetical protein B0H19DRAFT_1268077 [Mycena capillaripes]
MATKPPNKSKGRRGGRDRPTVPTMHVHQPHFGQVVSVSASGRSVTAPAHTLQTQPTVPSYFEEDFQTNAAVESVDFSYDLGDTSLVGEVQEPASDGIILKSKRKVYQNSDYPMLTWANHQDEYLDEFLRLEGRGYAKIYSTYMLRPFALLPDVHRLAPHRSANTLDPGMEWEFFERRTLKSLGLVIQLGHPPGTGCSDPIKAIVTFTVIDLTGIHNIDVNFCNCDSKIERRQQLMIVGEHSVTFVAQDCNFRLINRNVSSATKDPILNDGCGFFVNHAKYTQFLSNHEAREGAAYDGGGRGYVCPAQYVAAQRYRGFAALLRKRMAENVKEGQVHRDAFEAFDAALRETAPEMVEGWKKWVNDWESRQHTNGVLSPFELKEKVMTMRDIRNKLAKEELLRSGDGTEVEREDTPSTFILMGLEIEDTQRHLAIDVKAVTNPTDTQALDFLKRRKALIKRIRAFRKLQRTYMPKLHRFISAAQRTLWDSETERNAEEIRLFMPSEISEKNRRAKTCAVGLPEVEADLRAGEAREALHALRQGLRTRTMTNRFRLRHCTGQRMLTRGQGVLRQINLKIHKAKLRYRYSHNALKRLKGNGAWEKELQVLEDSDVRALNERALTVEEAEQRKVIHDYEDVAEEGGVAAFGVVALGEGRQTLSWIWYASRAEDPSETELVEALRVEWCKAYARMRRWQEDVVLVKEEMRRTIEYGYWSACEWAQRAEARAGTVNGELLEGLAAYALEQQSRETTTCEKLATDWAQIREKGRAYLARETVAGVEVVVPLEDEEERIWEEDDEEEGPPDYEDEGDDEILE